MMEVIFSICSVQRALWGNITPNLRAVFLQLRENSLQLIFYYDYPPSEEEIELASLTDTEVIADFPDDNTDCKVLVLPYPKPLPLDGYCLYLRHEEKQNNPFDNQLQPFIENKGLSNKAAVYCYAQVALLGCVTPNLRAVFLDLKKRDLFFYYEQNLVKEGELADQAYKRFTAYFKEEINCHLLIWPLTKKIPQKERCIYRRYEGRINS